MKAVIYSRISTVNKGQNVDNQLRVLRKVARQKGLEVVREISDEGVSVQREGMREKGSTNSLKVQFKKNGTSFLFGM